MKPTFIGHGFSSVGMAAMASCATPRIGQARGRVLPHDADQFSKWATGDSVSYTCKGGVVFFGGIGVGMGSLGAAKISQGSYQTSVQKFDDKNVLVRITKLHLDSL